MSARLTTVLLLAGMLAACAPQNASDGTTTSTGMRNLNTNILDCSSLTARERAWATPRTGCVDRFTPGDN